MKPSRSEKIWVVRPGDGTTAGEIVAKAKDFPSSFEEGRVFVGKRRALRASDPVRPGDIVRIGAPRALAATAGKEELAILFHGDGLLACNKPAGLPTVPDHAGASHSLVALAAQSIGKRLEELRITSRLDRGVSGVVLFALDDAAEARLKRARAEGAYRRRYVAIACTTQQFVGEGAPEAGAHGVWTRDIARAAEPRLRAASDDQGKKAETHWNAIALAPSLLRSESSALVPVLLAVDPITGRTHQIRVHAADGGAPLLGDRDYGGPSRLVLPNGRVLEMPRIALHAARVVVPGPHGPLDLRAPIPSDLESAWTLLGGTRDAWERAVLASSTQSAEVVRPF